MEQQKDFEHKDILQLIFDALPKPYNNGKPLKMDPIKLQKYSKLSAQIFQVVVDYLLNEKRTMHLRNKVILEKATYDKIIRQEEAIARGVKAGAQAAADTMRKHFKTRGLFYRLRFICTGRID